MKCEYANICKKNKLNNYNNKNNYITFIIDLILYGFMNYPCTYLCLTNACI